ncbi:WD40/YVTN/BNR-like repeat-containing protein, partial [Metallibacterium scheffleri]
SSIEPSHVARGTAYLTASRYMWDDFHPYVFETTDYGAHWTPITTGLPADQYAFVVRQDPNDARLLFLGTKNSVYASYDGGLYWHPLALNLPKVQVRDLAINVRQGDLVAATHGRSFWVLDNLALLEQMTRQPTVAADAAQVFAPETAWLTHAYGASPYAKFVTDAGANPPFGATVYFHIPADYDGKAPVTLSFVDAQGQVVRRFDLHLKATAPKPAATVRDNWTPIQAKEAADAKLTAIAPGMNRLQWNLRWPDATEVTGFQAPIAAGGLDDTVEGPVVVPGRYTAVLDFGGKKSEQAFTVALDPRLHPAPGALAARLALGLKIHAALDTLDRTLNQAIALRDQLDGAVAAGKLAKARAQPALNALDADIADLVALQIQSSEGSLLHETKLRSHLAYLAADIDLSYDRPTQAEYAVFDHLDRQAQAGERKLHADIAQGQRVL